MKLKFLRSVSALALTFFALDGAIASASDYSTTVQADSPLAYYRLNDPTARGNTNFNLGSASNANATNLNTRTFPGAIVGSSDRAQFFNGRSRSLLPFNAALNPVNTQPFTLEVWLYPAS